MPTGNITVTPYGGSVLSLPLLNEDNTLLLSDLDSKITAELADDQGTLDSSDDNISTFDDEALTYVGSGTFQPGIEVAGVIVPLGEAVPVVVFNADDGTGTEKSYFHFPEGDPGLLGAVAAILDIEDTPYEIFPNPYEGSAVADVYFGDDFGNQMFGEAGDDDIRGRDGDDSIIGGLGADTLLGNDGADTVSGGEGDDVVVGGFGADVVVGGDGLDRLEGGAGADTLLAGAHADTIEGGLGDDLIDGAGGFDTVLYTGLSEGVILNLENGVATGGGGSDTVSNVEHAVGSAGDDVVYGTELHGNRLEGSLGDDDLYGLNGRDTLLGGDGNDALYGGEDVDWLLGGDQDDRLDGGGGTDVLTGGDGADTFVLSDIADTGVGRWDRDEIRDFDASDGDVIDISGVDADAGAAGDQAFTFAGTDFTGTAGEVILEDHVFSGVDVTIASMDVDGDGEIDGQLYIVGGAEIDDFVL
ncbi:calcium-binding protein [Salipiger mucosus]|uniref:Hemolysin-type calcium-binding protein n=1 Tax=Salipiger mucosus DSM 16094 TaxID=1123237 RepID=S9Q696_9RHOB|nr:calcium-binding protein [Salipiger mucosus]EPX75542.1 Hemolysin-type calcium-binding protein [Salipiger mucosus DSM 16094]